MRRRNIEEDKVEDTKVVSLNERAKAEEAVGLPVVTGVTVGAKVWDNGDRAETSGTVSLTEAAGARRAKKSSTAFLLIASRRAFSSLFLLSRMTQKGSLSRRVSAAVAARCLSARTKNDFSHSLTPYSLTQIRALHFQGRRSNAPQTDIIALLQQRQVLHGHAF